MPDSDFRHRKNSPLVSSEALRMDGSQDDDSKASLLPGGDESKQNSRGLAGDWGSIALLSLLYTLQGIPMGLSGSIPLLLAKKGALTIDRFPATHRTHDDFSLFLPCSPLLILHSGVCGPSYLFVLLVAFFAEAVLGAHRRQLLLAFGGSPQVVASTRTTAVWCYDGVWCGLLGPLDGRGVSLCG